MDIRSHCSLLRLLPSVAYSTPHHQFQPHQPLFPSYCAHGCSFSSLRSLLTHHLLQKPSLTAILAQCGGFMRDADPLTGPL